MAEEIRQSSPDQMQVGADTRRPEDSRLDRMPEEPKASRVEKSMPERPEAAPPTARARMPLMRPFDPHAVKSMSPEEVGRGERGDMKVSSGASPVGHEGAGYVRLRLRVAGERMTIQAASEVKGPLIQPHLAVGEHVYEVLLDGRRIAAEGLPDLGTRRSLPRPGEHEHHFSERATMEFNVRIPRAALRSEALARVSVALYRFDDASPKPLEGGIAAAFGPEAHIVAAIDELGPETVAPGAREELGRLFPGWEDSSDEPSEKRKGEGSGDNWLQRLVRALISLLRQLLGGRSSR